MRVLFASQEFPPETGWGGIGTYVATIAPALARTGAEVHVLSVVDGQPPGEALVDGVRVHRRPLRRPRGVGRVTRLWMTWDRLSVAAAVEREARRLGVAFDVCESPEWMAEGLGLALRRSLPVAVRLHSGARQVFPFLGYRSVDARLAIRCEESLVRRADVVIGSRSQVSAVAGPLGLDPARVRTLTCPVGPFSPLPPGSDRPRVLFAGRFESRKGADVLIRAVPRLLSRVPDAKVVLLGTDRSGNGSYGRRLRTMAADVGDGGTVEFLDWGRGADIAAELSRATVCAVPSRWESFGYVAAEAEAHGRAVVASRIPALEDIVADGVTGRLVPPDDPDALADALGDVLAEPERAREMGAAGARRIAESCDPDGIAEATLDAYELAATRWRGRRRRR